MIILNTNQDKINGVIIKPYSFIPETNKLNCNFNNKMEERAKILYVLKT
jgi:hypothetical protein